MSGREARTGEDDEDAMACALRMAGARPGAPPGRAERVRTAVHARWVAAGRRRVRRRAAAAMVIVVVSAAAVLLVASGRFGVRQAPPMPGPEVAVVERVEGEAGARLSVEQPVRAGEWIETGSGGRVALRFADGASVRLDTGSRARALSASTIELTAGAVYVDTGRDSGRFEVRTTAAIARDIGTQFEVRLVDRALRLRVRTGIVELRDRARSMTARGGTEITLSDGHAASQPIAAHGPEWDWMAGVAPPFEIEGAPLSVFLERTAREHGWSVHYADSALAREAAGIVLHGSVRGLSPQEAIAVAIATSGLEHRLESGAVVVLRARDTK